ncbi:MAG: hypothetical protein ACHQWU_10245 [Gemmatimonadales bacterium]
MTADTHHPEDSTDQPFDLSALDPTRDRARFAAAVASIARNVDRDSAAHAPISVAGEIASWSRPALIAAGIILMLSIPALSRLTVPPFPPPQSALGIPDRLAELFQSPHTPSFGEIEAALSPTPAPR